MKTFPVRTYRHRAGFDGNRSLACSSTSVCWDGDSFRKYKPTKQNEIMKTYRTFAERVIDYANDSLKHAIEWEAKVNNYKAEGHTDLSEQCSEYMRDAIDNAEFWERMAVHN